MKRTYAGRMQGLWRVVLFLFILIFAAGVSYGGNFTEKKLTDGQTFKQEIAKFKVAWVKYTFNGISAGIRKREKDFWLTLQREFGGQVNAFLTVDASGWDYRNGYDRILHKEIGTTNLPAFVLYEKGRVAGKKYPVVLIGAPKPEKAKRLLKSIREESFLK